MSTVELTLLTMWLDCGKRVIRKISNSESWASYGPYHGLELPNHGINVHIHTKCNLSIWSPTFILIFCCNCCNSYICYIKWIMARCYDVWAKLYPVICTDADYVVTLVTSRPILTSIQTVLISHQVNGTTSNISLWYCSSTDYIPIITENLCKNNHETHCIPQVWHQWVNARKMKLQCISNRVMSFLH